MAETVDFKDLGVEIFGEGFYVSPEGKMFEFYTRPPLPDSLPPACREDTTRSDFLRAKLEACKARRAATLSQEV